MEKDPSRISGGPDCPVPHHHVNLRGRGLLAALVDVHLLIAAFLISALLRFEFALPSPYIDLFIAFLPVVIIVKLGVACVVRVYRGILRYTGLADLARLVVAHSASSLLILGLGFAVTLLGVPRIPVSVVLIDFFISLGLMGGSRLAYRYLHEFATTRSIDPRQRTRALIAGAGDSGVMALKRIRQDPDGYYQIVGFLDDAPCKQGRRIEAVPVLGSLEDTAEVVNRYGIHEVIFAIPSLHGEKIKNVVDQCRGRKIRFSILPSLSKILSGEVSLPLKELSIEALLPRAPMHFNPIPVISHLRGRSVLITGAGGSIGSEICRQVVRFRPKCLVLYERFENNLCEIDRELQRHLPFVSIVPYVGDILDRDRLEGAFGQYKPSVVYHAAAHKHVHMMEANPVEAVKNNILGTLNVARVADKYKAERFVMISTDKAVNPTGVMGASKRVAEMVCQCLFQDSSTRFMTVRFGNVLNSAGSVIPLFCKQIAQGGPVTVTHPEAWRYFMTIPEAAELVTQAGALGRGGEIMLLDMGKEVRIMDLANDMIKLHGKVPGQDVSIEIIGLRPGEKLHEELLSSREEAVRSPHPMIKVARGPVPTPSEIYQALEELSKLVCKNADESIADKLYSLIPESPRNRTMEPSPPIDSWECTAENAHGAGLQ